MQDPHPPTVSQTDESLALDRGWVWGQKVVLLLVVILPPLERFLIGPGYEILSWYVMLVVGLLMIALMFTINNNEARTLSNNLRVEPTPVPDGQLVDQGIYGLVRHPIYAGGLLGVLGWAIIWQSWSGLVMTVVTYVFFLGKAQREERLLREAYSTYRDYEERVPGRFVPLPRRG